MTHTVKQASGDVTFTGTYDKTSERVANMIVTEAGESASVIFENLTIKLKKDDQNYHGHILSSYANTLLKLNGVNTLTHNQGTPIVIQNGLTIGGDGKLIVVSEKANAGLGGGAPAIGGGDNANYQIGDIYIERGHIDATGYDAPAIGDLFNADGATSTIKIVGGAIYAKNNSDTIPDIAAGDSTHQRPVVIMGGSVSADVQKPENTSGTPLVVNERNFGREYAGTKLSFDVAGDYDYHFEVPEDGVAWLWAPTGTTVPAV